MTLLIIGIIVFAGSHLAVMLLPRLRESMLGRMGEGPYKGVFSLVSLAGLALMIYGFYSTRGLLEGTDYLYTPAPWARHLAMTLVLAAATGTLAWELDAALADRPAPAAHRSSPTVPRHGRAALPAP